MIGLTTKMLRASAGGKKGLLGTPTYFPMRNTATDPTSAYWRTNVAPAGGYTFIPYDGIYTVNPATSLVWFILENNFNDPDVAEWDMSMVTNVESLFTDCPQFNQDIGPWDVSKIPSSGFTLFLQNARKFNQDCSQWCVSHISSVPNYFASNTSAWQASYKPVWGTCPRGENQ